MQDSLPRERVLLTVVYGSQIACGAIGVLGDPSPTLERQGGVLLTLVWSSLCVLAGVIGLCGGWMHRRPWELLGALIGASASAAWAASLIIQAVKTASWDPVTAICMGLAFTSLLAYRASRVARSPRPDPGHTE